MRLASKVFSPPTVRRRFSLEGSGGSEGLYVGGSRGGVSRWSGHCCSCSPPCRPRETDEAGPHPHDCLTHRQLVDTETQHWQLQNSVRKKNSLGVVKGKVEKKRVK